MPTHAKQRSAALVLLLSLGLGGLALPLAAEEQVVPSERCRGLWIVPIAFGEEPHQTLRMVLDTGAWRSSVDPDSIHRISGRKIRVGKTVRLRDGQAGPLQIRKLPAEVHSFDHLQRALGLPIDGILGFSAFSELLLTLDYPADEIRVSKGSLPAVDEATVFRDFGRKRPFLALEVSGTRLPVLIDSGSTGGLTIREEDDARWAVEPVATGASARYNGIRIDRTGRLAEDIAYGPLTLERPIAEIIENGIRLAGEPILRRFVWTFDPQNRRIRMIADSDAPIESEAVRGVGVALRPVEAGFEVLHVFSGMPGAEAGILSGDVVLEVDGKPVFERGCTRPTGDDTQGPVVWSIERAGETIQVELETRELVP